MDKLTQTLTLFIVKVSILTLEIDDGSKVNNWNGFVDSLGSLRKAFNS